MMAFLMHSAQILLPIPVLEYKTSAQPYYESKTAAIHVRNVFCCMKSTFARTCYGKSLADVS
jgi:hypothetical protein